MDLKGMLSDMRGHPTKCDFCGEEKLLDKLEPEEAGMWICHACLDYQDECENDSTRFEEDHP